MNPISKALDEIKFRIPMPVLTVAFKESAYNWRQAPTSLDEIILTKVIRPRVLVDTNLIGGQQATIPLDGLAVNFLDAYTTVYRIPKDLTKNRTIVSVLSVGYMPYINAYSAATYGNGGNVFPTMMNEVTNAAQRVGDSHSSTPPVSTASVELVAENTILVRDQYRITSALALRCMLANEENMNNLNPRSFLAFSNLCTYAVKSYIYKELRFKVDQAFIQSGAELGVMKAYVDECADAEENYQTYLIEKWSGVAVANDMTTYQRFIKSQLSPGV